MSYDLNFWKYKNNVYLNNQEVYEKCSEGEIIEGLEELPIDQIKQKIAEEFSDWATDDSDFFENTIGNGAFDLFTTAQFIRFNCSFKMNGEDMNRLIDIMLKYDCPLYDPQVPQRYDNKS